MIRDPTERFISEFYFRRRLQNEGVKKGEKKWYDEVIHRPCYCAAWKRSQTTKITAVTTANLSVRYSQMSQDWRADNNEERFHRKKSHFVQVVRTLQSGQVAQITAFMWWPNLQFSGFYCICITTDRVSRHSSSSMFDSKIKKARSTSQHAPSFDWIGFGGEALVASLWRWICIFIVIRFPN